MANRSILLIEAFYTGSHKQLIDLLHREVPGTELVTLPGKKWHWKARTSALWLSQVIPKVHSFKTLFTSSVLNLAELVALRADLAGVRKVLYFHENQLVYPVRKHQDRDFQFGYNQILSCLVADVVLFNSDHNMNTFLNSINSHLKLIPDHRPKGIADLIKAKCHVLHFPIIFPTLEDLNETNEVHRKSDNVEELGIKVSETYESETEDINKESDKTEEVDRNITENKDLTNTAAGEFTEMKEKFSHSVTRTQREIESCEKGYEKRSEKIDCTAEDERGTLVTAREKPGIDQLEQKELGEVPMKKCKMMENSGPLHIVWPHRWEHDKDPETFFKVLTRLHNDGVDFRVSVLGETYSDVPDIFEKSRLVLKEKILNWGFLPSKQQYYRVLKSADCVVSTAKHEFFGVAMLEAVHLGCYPLCPHLLVYPEIFPADCLYNTEQQLFKRLREFCRKPYFVRQKTTPINTSQYTWDSLKDQFLKFIM